VKFLIFVASHWFLTLFSVVSAQELVTLSTRSDVTQTYFVASLPKDPQALVVLFPGSGGLVRMRRDEDEIKFDTDNFLIRSRGEFVKRGVVAAILDAPSDRQTGWGMGDEFRLGEGSLHGCFGCRRRHP